VQPFQQAYEAATDEAGIHLAKALEWMAEGDPQKLMELKDYIDNMRGLASSARAGVSPNQAAGEAALLLAPRYRRAVAALHASALQGGLRGRLARNAYPYLLSGTVFAAGGITLALGKAQRKSDAAIQEEFEQVMNPSSHRFLMWRIGNQWVGPGSKINSDIRLLAKIATRPDDFLDFEEFNANPGVKWVRGQLAWVPSTAWEYLTGEDYLGEPITRDFSGDPIGAVTDLGKKVGENFMFLWAQGAAFEGGTAKERATRGVAEFWGLRAYPQGDRDRMDVIARELYGKPFEELRRHKQKELTASLRGTRIRPSPYREEVDRIDEGLEAKLTELDGRAANLLTTGMGQGQRYEPWWMGNFRSGMAEMGVAIPSPKMRRAKSSGCTLMLRLRRLPGATRPTGCCSREKSIVLRRTPRERRRSTNTTWEWRRPRLRRGTSTLTSGTPSLTD
jgi:hypothetical protein